MSHLPEESLACSWMYAIIQLGQAMVAKRPFWKPAFQSGDHASILADRPALIASMVLLNAPRTAGLVSTTTLSLVSYRPMSDWPRTARYMTVGPSMKADSGILAAA